MTCGKRQKQYDTSWTPDLLASKYPCVRTAGHEGDHLSDDGWWPAGAEEPFPGLWS